jgi:hypothetical protein
MAKRILNAYIDWNGIAALGVSKKADRAFLYVAPWKRSGRRVIPLSSKGIILAQTKIGGQR